MQVQRRKQCNREVLYDQLWSSCPLSFVSASTLITFKRQGLYDQRRLSCPLSVVSASTLILLNNRARMRGAATVLMCPSELAQRRRQQWRVEPERNQLGTRKWSHIKCNEEGCGSTPQVHVSMKKVIHRRPGASVKRRTQDQQKTNW